MKKAIFLFCFFAFGFNAFAYWPIVSVFRSDRDLFGYREVSHQLVSLPDGGFGWEITCQFPGLERCRRYGGLNDTNDNEAFEKLMDEAESQIALKIFSGSAEYVIKVSNEDFFRKYTLVWETDVKGDGVLELFRMDFN